MEFLAVPLLMFAALGLLFVDHGAEASDKDNDDENSDSNQALRQQSFGDRSDDVKGTEGRDELELGDGDDTASGGAGDDRLFGEDGNDQVWGGPGDDRIFLGDGNDFNYDAEDPKPIQVAGDDFIRGGGGDDRIVDFLGSNTLFGGLGNDLVDGVDGNGEPETPDTIFGGFGRDIIAGDNGDEMTGGADQDGFFVVLNAGPEAEPAVIKDYEPGEGIFVTVPLAFQGADAVLERNGDGLDLVLGEQVILRVEGIIDPNQVDLFFDSMDVADQTISPGELVLGTQGDDQIATKDGDDAIFAARGDDDIRSGAGDDYVSLRTSYPFVEEGSLGWGNNTVDAGAGDDRVLGGQGGDTIFGGSGGDLLLGGGGADHLEGGDGNDYLDGSDNDVPGADTLNGGRGADRLIIDDGDIATGGGGFDTFDLAEHSSGDAAVTITDFNPDQDRIEVSVEGGDLTVSMQAVGDTTHVLVGSRVVAILEDTRPGDVPNRAIQVSSWT